MLTNRKWLQALLLLRTNSVWMLHLIIKAMKTFMSLERGLARHYSATWFATGKWNSGSAKKSHSYPPWMWSNVQLSSHLFFFLFSMNFNFKTRPWRYVCKVCFVNHHNMTSLCSSTWVQGQRLQLCRLKQKDTSQPENPPKHHVR